MGSKSAEEELCKAAWDSVGARLEVYMVGDAWSSVEALVCAFCALEHAARTLSCTYRHQQSSFGRQPPGGSA